MQQHRDLRPTWLAGTLALALSTGLAGVAQAQRQPPDKAAQRQETRDRIQNMTPEERQQYFQQRFDERWRQMTPDQRTAFTERQQQRAQMQEQMIEQGEITLVQEAGYTDKAEQDVILTFIKDQKALRAPLLKMAKELAAQLKAPGHTDEQNQALKTGLDAFRKAVAADNIRYAAALANLDAQVHYTTDPRMETLLTLLGIVGQESPTVGGPTAIFPTLSGRGGGFGRGGGGAGGGAPAQ